MNLNLVGDEHGHVEIDPGEHVGLLFRLRVSGAIVKEWTAEGPIRAHVDAGHIRAEAIRVDRVEEVEVHEDEETGERHTFIRSSDEKETLVGSVERWVYESPCDWLPTTIDDDGATIHYVIPTDPGSIKTAKLMLMGVPVERGEPGEDRAPILLDINGVDVEYGPTWGSATYFGVDLAPEHLALLGGPVTVAVRTAADLPALGLDGDHAHHGALTVNHVG
jgi:hypothetical protein